MREALQYSRDREIKKSNKENFLPIVARLIVDGMMWVNPPTDTIDSFFFIQS